MHPLPAARIGDLPADLRPIQPHIVHIACHGEEDDGSLVLTARTNDRKSDLLLPDDLAETLRAYQAEAAEKIRLVVLAGCWTDAAARAVSHHVDAAIGMDGAIEDPAVVNIFTPEFYAALGAGRSVANAVESACAALRSEHRYGDADMVQLYGSPGSDPAQLKPLAWDRPFCPTPTANISAVGSARSGPPSRSADIIEESKAQISLLDVYVPLPVDCRLALRLKKGRFVDWQVTRSDEAAADAPPCELWQEAANDRIPPGARPGPR